MRKILLFLVVLVFLVSCEKELAKKPDRLIDEEKMESIIYDLTILEAIRTQNPDTMSYFKLSSNEYIFKKYKIDSTQFAQNNIYYASDYKEYGKMFERIKARLDKYKSKTDSLFKIEKKKDSLQLVKKKNLKIKKENDSIKKTKKKKAVL